MIYKFLTVFFSDEVNLDTLDDLLQEYGSQIIAVIPSEVGSLVLLDYEVTALAKLMEDLDVNFECTIAKPTTKENVFQYIANRVLYSIKAGTKKGGVFDYADTPSYNDTIERASGTAQILMYLPSDKRVFFTQGDIKVGNISATRYADIAKFKDVLLSNLKQIMGLPEETSVLPAQMQQRATGNTKK